MTYAVLHHCVFIDECSFNIWRSRSQGRALREERAYRKVCGQRGRNATVALAVSATNGLVFHSAMFGGMNRQCFSELLAQTRENLDPEEIVIFIYDGTPAHNSPTNPADHTELKKLPPHSPFLNIVEQEMVLIRAEIIHMSKFKPGTVEKNIINYRSSGRNRTHAFAMSVQCSYH